MEVMGVVGAVDCACSCCWGLLGLFRSGVAGSYWAMAYTPGCLVGSLLIDVALGLCWMCFACSASRFDMLFALGLGLHLMLGHSCCNLVRVTQRTASLLCVAWVVLPKCSMSRPAVTRLTVYRGWPAFSSQRIFPAMPCARLGPLRSAVARNGFHSRLAGGIFEMLGRR